METKKQRGNPNNPEAFGRERAELTCRKNACLAQYSDEPFSDGMPLFACSRRKVSENWMPGFWRKTTSNFSAKSTSSKAPAVLALVGSTSRFVSTIKCTAG